MFESVYRVRFIVEMEDAPIHTDDCPECAEPTCPCHTVPIDPAVSELQEWKEQAGERSYLERYRRKS